jgi:hypothetical protein
MTSPKPAHETIPNWPPSNWNGGRDQIGIGGRLRWNPHPNGEAQSPRSVGLVDGRPRAHRLRTDQAERIAHAAAVELEVWKPTAGDQLGLAVKSPWCRRYAYGAAKHDGRVPAPGAASRRQVRRNALNLTRIFRNTRKIVPSDSSQYLLCQHAPPRGGGSKHSAWETMRSTISPAVGMSWIKAQASPTMTAATSKSPRSRAAA